MGQALAAAEILIEHVDHQSTTVLERRQLKNRHQGDLMDDLDYTGSLTNSIREYI